MGNIADELKPECFKRVDRDFIEIKIPMFVVMEHMHHYPTLEENMKGKKRIAIYSSFLCTLPLLAGKRLSKEMKEDILKYYKVI